MFYSDLTTDTVIRWLRSSWTWRVGSKAVCYQCLRHVVTAGLRSCPQCGSDLRHLSTLPSGGKRKRWRRAVAQAIAWEARLNREGWSTRPPWQPYSPAELLSNPPRRFPTTGIPPRYIQPQPPTEQQ